MPVSNLRPAFQLSLLVLLYLAMTAAAQTPEQESFVVVRAGRLLTMAGPAQDNVEIVLVDGKIRLVGKDLSYPTSARIIDARHEVVMPGMIQPHTRWQLPGYSRSGLHGDRSVAQEIYLDDIDFEPFLAAGFTTVCYMPDGTGIPGVAAIYRVAGDQRELGPGYLRITMNSPGRDKKVLRDAITKARQEIEKVEKAQTMGRGTSQSQSQSSGSEKGARGQRNARQTASDAGRQTGSSSWQRAPGGRQACRKETG